MSSKVMSNDGGVALALSPSGRLTSPGLWERLAQRAPVRLHRIVVEAVPAEASKAVADAAGVEQVPVVDEAWKQLFGRGPYVLETDVGSFRVVQSGWGWHADEVEREDVFVREPGRPIDPR